VGPDAGFIRVCHLLFPKKVGPDGRRPTVQAEQLVGVIDFEARQFAPLPYIIIVSQASIDRSM
jgi:hypothetical protein